MNCIDFHAFAMRLALCLLGAGAFVWLSVDAKGCANCRARGDVWVREQWACVERRP